LLFALTAIRGTVVPAFSPAPCSAPLDIGAAHLVRGLHPAHLDALAAQQLLGARHALRRREAGAAEDPGVVDVEDVEDVGAGVHGGQAAVVGAQHQVRDVGRDWEGETTSSRVKDAD